MKQPAHNCALIVETKKKCFIIVWFIEPRMWQRAKTTPNNIPGATTKTRKRSESEAWCRFDGKASCFPSFRKSKQKSFFRSPFPRPISWWPGRQKNKSMRSIDVKYLRWGWNSVDSLRIFFCCFCFRLCVFTMLFQVVHRSLNRPQSAMDWFTLVTSTLRLFFLRSPVTHIIAKKKDCTRLAGIVQKKQADGSCFQSAIHWHNFDGHFGEIFLPKISESAFCEDSQTSFLTFNCFCVSRNLVFRRVFLHVMAQIANCNFTVANAVRSHSSDTRLSKAPDLP